MNKIFCDLCGRPIDDKPSRLLKVKEKKWFGDCSGWVKIDAHNNCIRDLMEVMRIAREEKESGTTVTGESR